MNTSTIYIDAAQAGITYARKFAATTGGIASKKTYTLGIEAVRTCGYQAQEAKKHAAISAACFVLGSIDDDGITALMKEVYPSIPTETRISAILNLSAFKSSTDVEATMKRKAAEACDDIILAFHGTIAEKESAKLKSLVDNCYNELQKAQENAKNALENSNQRSRTIKGLLESRACAEESRRRAEASRVHSENLIQVLGAQLVVDDKSTQRAVDGNDHHLQ